MYREITIQFTEQCNAHCPFCIAPDKEDTFLTDRDFDEFVQFIKKESIDSIHITGGEPSLHPHFDEFVSRLQKIASLVIYTNFAIEGAIDSVESDNPSQIVFLVNTNSWNYCGKQGSSIGEANIRKALLKGFRVALSHTFDSAAAPIEERFAFLIGKMHEYSLTNLRLSQAVAFEKADVGLNRDEIKYLYHYVAKRILEWKEEGMSIYFDCPVPPCYIDKRDFSVLRRNHAVSIKCIPKVFVMWNLNVTHCYSTMNEPGLPRITEFENIDSAKLYSEDLLKKKLFCSQRFGCTKCGYERDGLPCGCPSYTV